ncbi:hypothetical protein HDU81_009480, partial [Chytriomyces hyalinus]
EHPHLASFCTRVVRPDDIEPEPEEIEGESDSEEPDSEFEELESELEEGDFEPEEPESEPQEPEPEPEEVELEFEEVESEPEEVDSEPEDPEHEESEHEESEPDNISPETLNYIFKLYNGAVYREEVRSYHEIIFSVIFSASVTAPEDRPEGETDEEEEWEEQASVDDEEDKLLVAALLKWLQANFGKEFPRYGIIFLNPGNDKVEYHRGPHIRIRRNAADSGYGGDGTASSVNSANQPHFLEYRQISLRSAIDRALGGMWEKPESETEAGIHLSACLDREATFREQDMMWDHCVDEFRQ